MCKSAREQRLRRLSRQAATPAVGMQVPSDLDLAGAVG
jgi:hypothetical protein